MKAFLNATVVDGSAEPSPATRSIIVGDSGRIDAAGPGDLPVPEGCEVSDCHGQTAYPGLIDMHTASRWWPESAATPKWASLALPPLPDLRPCGATS